MDPIRTGLAILWTLVAVFAAGNALRSRPGHWKLCAGIASVLVSTAVWRWHAQLLKLSQGALRNLGIYENRLLLKIMIALVILVASALCFKGAKAGLLRSARGSRLPLVACALAASYLALLTLSLDDFMPWFLAEAPGRFVAEYALAGLALGGTLRVALAAPIANESPHDHA